jgi:anaerobic magnesium-protoporphyrin IX monomethyl ester cyclase
MIALYNPSSSASRKPILPIALLAIGATLAVPWVLIDGNVDPRPIDRLVGALAGTRKPILAVTAMPGPQVADAVIVVRAVKERVPGLIVVWGGYFATQHTATCLGSDLVDYVVRGHGEPAFARLVAAIRAGTPVDGIPGVAWRGGETAMAPVPRAGELPELPLDRIPVERYVRSTVLGRRTVGYHSSYGCPYVCNFCAVVSMVGGRWTAQPAERVAAAFAGYRERYNVDAVELYDNNFFVSESRCREFAERVRPLGMRWWGEGRVDTLLGFDDATWAAMRDGGLAMVFMGAESGSAETLRRMDKGGTLKPDDTLALVERMAGFGVVPELSFVLGSPPDPEGDVAGTLAFVREVKRRNPATEIILYLYTPEPVAGELWDQASAAGFRWPATLEAWADSAWSDVIQRRSAKLPWVDAGMVRRLKDFERVLNAAYPTSTDPRLTGIPRALLKGLGGWRWRTGTYARPWELMALQRVIRYQRPETSGF